MRKTIKIGNHEVEAGCVIDGGRFRATLLVRGARDRGLIHAVGYYFSEGFSSDKEAMMAAEKFAQMAALNPDRYLTAADLEFALH